MLEKQLRIVDTYYRTTYLTRATHTLPPVSYLDGGKPYLQTLVTSPPFYLLHLVFIFSTDRV